MRSEREQKLVDRLCVAEYELDALKYRLAIGEPACAECKACGHTVTCGSGQCVLWLAQAAKKALA